METKKAQKRMGGYSLNFLRPLLLLRVPYLGRDQHVWGHLFAGKAPPTSPPGRISKKIVLRIPTLATLDGVRKKRQALIKAGLGIRSKLARFVIRNILFLSFKRSNALF
jgi:hypothetical protein